MRSFIIFIFLLSNALAIEDIKLKNIILNKELKTYKNLTFLDSQREVVQLNSHRGKLIMLNFWATWCAPCKEEMPSLDLLQSRENLDNLKIFPINVGQDDLDKSLNFFDDLKIKNLKPYFDSPITLAKKFQLRGIPTSIIINKRGEEFARIVGSIDFTDKKFIKWISNYN